MWNDRYFELSKFRILKERKINYSILLFSILKKNLYLFKLFVESKYVMIYTRKIGNLWNFDSFKNFEICYFPKLSNLGNF